MFGQASLEKRRSYRMPIATQTFEQIKMLNDHCEKPGQYEYYTGQSVFSTAFWFAAKIPYKKAILAKQ